ncbi:class I SAM-dependent methyltransferase [Kribbella sp. CA-293567]|uniref:class I SAM-dependent methyltransferase n=1 Tax=Kribbella sp. CA-293567 TaxID=3002436 RepID=UPI0022DDE6F1|nr:class I SAM-dependent methyltransferase [Kribbella sp. CA-293567]WBQ08171.1 methyltransferase domain-containing protein [Kribbella sp. CA-293567]
MSEGYVEGFAQAYDQFWQPYPTKSAASLLKLLQSAAPDARAVLDIGCGTGIVAQHLVRAGYAVTGLDKSPAMLARARERLGESAVLIEGDAADFAVDEQFPVAVSTYDIPNHLPDLERIADYLRCVYRAVSPGGLFVFDIATVVGLRGMNTVQIRETDEAMLLFRGALNESLGVGFYRISGVVQAADGRYDRFETTMTNIVVPVDRLLELLAEAGWVGSYLAAQDDLLAPLTEVPGTHSHLFVVSRKP